jgi:hypothetical protein
MRQQHRKEAPKTQGPTSRTIGINLPAETWDLMNRVASGRAQLRGGRASVSALVAELVERRRNELEKEVKVIRSVKKNLDLVCLKTKPKSSKP